MLDGQGYVAEATSANVFCVHRGVLRTPPTTAALPGITRDTVLELAAEAGIPTVIEHFGIGDLYVADEAFLTGTGAGIVPIRCVDGRSLPAFPGEATRLVQAGYQRAWADPRYSTPLRSPSAPDDRPAD
jgi:branched-chain amino acid aminotransferase